MTKLFVYLPALAAVLVLGGCGKIATNANESMFSDVHFETSDTAPTTVTHFHQAPVEKDREAVTKALETVQKHLDKSVQGYVDAGKAVADAKEAKTKALADAKANGADEAKLKEVEAAHATLVKTADDKWSLSSLELLIAQAPLLKALGINRSHITVLRSRKEARFEFRAKAGEKPFIYTHLKLTVDNGKVSGFELRLLLPDDKPDAKE